MAEQAAVNCCIYLPVITPVSWLDTWLPKLGFCFGLKKGKSSFILVEPACTLIASGMFDMLNTLLSRDGRALLPVGVGGLWLFERLGALRLLLALDEKIQGLS